MPRDYTLPFQILQLTPAERSLARAYLKKFENLWVEWDKRTSKEKKSRAKKKNGSHCDAAYEKNPFKIQEPLNRYTIKMILSWVYELPDYTRNLFITKDYLSGIEKELVCMYEAAEEEKRWHHEKYLECWCLCDCSDCENENSDCATSSLRPLDGMKQGATRRNYDDEMSVADSGFSWLDCDNSRPLRCILNSRQRLYPEIPPAAVAAVKNINNNKSNNGTKKKNNNNNNYNKTETDDTLPNIRAYKNVLAEEEKLGRKMRTYNSRNKTKPYKKAKRQTKLTPTHKGGEELNKLKFTSRSGRVTKRFALMDTNKL
eukprot:jgi/Picsp_1/70/NSC_00070-R1_---NA---